MVAVGRVDESPLLLGGEYGHEATGEGGRGADPNSLTPGLVRTLDEGARTLVRHPYNDALAPVFAWLASLAALAFVLPLFLKRRPLATENR